MTLLHKQKANLQLLVNVLEVKNKAKMNSNFPKINYPILKIAKSKKTKHLNLLYIKFLALPNKILIDVKMHKIIAQIILLKNARQQLQLAEIKVNMIYT